MGKIYRGTPFLPAPFVAAKCPQPAEHGVLHYMCIQEKLDNLPGKKHSWIDPVDFGAIPMAINTKLETFPLATWSTPTLTSS
jgi:hypothetical protein